MPPNSAGALSGAGAHRPGWRYLARLLAGAGAVLLGLLALMLAAALLGDAWAVPLIALAGVLAAGAILLVVVFVDRQVFVPMQRLTRAAGQLSAGHLDDPIEVDGVAEVHTLAAGVDEAARLRGQRDELTAERNRVSVVLSSMADGLIIVDRELRVQRVNDAAARLLHIGAQGAAGESLTSVVRDHELAGILQTAVTERRQLPRADVRVAPFRPGRAGDPRVEPHFVRASGFPISGGSAAGDPAGLLMLQDVTELRRSEVIRREFVGNVSHELRTPLASLKALVETLEEGALDDPPADAEFLSQMHVEVDSLTQMVQELLDLSKIESGQATLRPEPVPAAGLAAEAESRLRMQAERAGVVLTVDAPPDLPTVRADPARVVQVLINLLHNAIKFTPDGGEVVLRVTAAGQQATFTVSDDGVGIAPLDQPRIFERFYKVDRSRASGGTGLGLAIAKHIIQAHGGHIWVESAGEGRGATFAFTLPVAAPSERPGPAAGASATPLNGPPGGDGTGDLLSPRDRGSRVKLALVGG